MNCTTARYAPMPFESCPLFHGHGGPAGALMQGNSMLALFARGSWRPVAIEWARFVVGVPDGFLVLAGTGPTWAVDAEGRVTPGPEATPGPHARLANAALAWDPEAGRALLFGGTFFDKGNDRDQAGLWAWREGAWHAVKATGRVTARSGALAAWVPPLRALVVLGGYSTRHGHLPETLHLDGKRWTAFASPVEPELAVRSMAFMAWDAPSSQLVYGRHDGESGIRLFRYLGRGEWEPFGRIEGAYDGARAAFDAAGRQVVLVLGAGPADGTKWAAVGLGPWLDALPRVQWSVTTAAPAEG